MTRFLYILDTSTGDAQKIAVPYNGQWICVDAEHIENFLNNHDITKIRFEVRPSDPATWIDKYISTSSAAGTLAQCPPSGGRQTISFREMERQSVSVQDSPCPSDPNRARSIAPLQAP